MPNASRKNMAKVNANRTLAAVLRAHGLTPNGEVWTDAKRLVGEGLAPKQAARLIRSTLPEAAQVAAIAKATVKPVIAHAPVAQAPQPKGTRLSSRAKDVKAGRVLRDAKGRLVSREVQDAFAELA